MLRFAFYQHSLLHIDPDHIGLAKDSFERLLPDVLPELVSREDFRGFYSESVGTDSCCPLMLTAMLLLQFRFGVSDPELVQRCRRDLGWRYAIGLEETAKPPAVSTVRRFREKLRELKGDDFLFRTVLQLAVKQGALTDTALQAVDSTNTDCRGAIVDTYNLVAVGIGNVLKKLAGCLNQRPEALAQQWGMSRYLTRSIKGQVRIDWSDEKARNALLTEEIRDADRLVENVSALGLSLPAHVTEAVSLLQQVARQDVEEQADGTFRIAAGTAPGRVISVTDPEARHGRKSSSKVINGFKLHVLGTIKSQFVTGIDVTDAGTHDAAPTPNLIAHATGNGLKPNAVVGDAAYGSGANHRACNAVGVELHTKMPAHSRKDVIFKNQFEINLETMKVTCPNGAETSEFHMGKDPSGSGEIVPHFRFAKEDCQQCPLRQRCSKAVIKRGFRTVALSPFEPELQKSKAFNQSAEAPAVLRSRSAVERLLSHLVRMGMRHARFFGMRATQFQAYMVGAAYNLQRYMTLLVRASRHAGT